MKAVFKIILASFILIWNTGCEEENAIDNNSNTNCLDYELHYAIKSCDDCYRDGRLYIKEMKFTHNNTQDTLYLQKQNEEAIYLDFSEMWSIRSFKDISPQEGLYNQLEITYGEHSYFDKGQDSLPAFPKGDKYHQIYSLEEPVSDCYMYRLIVDLDLENDPVTDSLIYVYDTYLEVPTF